MGFGLTDVYNKFFAITKSDTVSLTTEQERSMRALYVGTVGDLVAVMPDSSTVTFVGVPAGTVLPIRVRRINSTSTTAGGFVGLAQV